MIQYVEVINHLGESLVLEMTRPEKSGLVIKDISGLGPSKSTINVSKIATKDGGTFNSAHIESRNITLNLGCYLKENEKNFTIEDSRQMAYKYFPIKRPITLIIATDNRLVRTTGYVESNEVSIFSENESMNISIICPDPFFYSTQGDMGNKTYSGIESKFSFPFSNDSYTDKLIQFGLVKDHPEQSIIYDGEYQVGLTISIYAKGKVTNPRIINTVTGEIMAINSSVIEKLTGSGIVAGDEIIINTRKGYKSVTLFRTGKTYNIIGSLRSFATWFTLEKGENLFTYDTEYSGGDILINYSWDTAYEGI